MKKIMAILLITAMVFSLASCTKKEDPKEPVKTESPDTPTDTAADTEPEADSTDDIVVDEEPEDTEHPVLSKFEAVDLGGRVIRILQNWDDTYDSDMPEPDPDTATEDTYLQYDNIRRIEDKYNCKVDKVNMPFEQIQEQITTSVMAGDPIADLVDCDSQWLVPFVVNDIILSYDEFMPANASLYEDEEFTKATAPIGGKYYEFDIAGDEIVQAYFLGVNMDIINASGAPNPVELYEKGEWTWESFLEVAKATTKDTDGDGITDQWGLGGWNCDLWKNFVASNSGKFYDDVAGVSALDAPNVLEALSFVGRLYNDEKVVYMPGGTELWDWDGNTYAFKEGKVAMFNSVFWMVPDAPDNLTYNYNVVPYPKGPSSTDNVSWYTVPRGKIIPRGTKDPQYAYQIYEELAYWKADADLIPGEAMFDFFRKKNLPDDGTERLIKMNQEGYHRIDLYTLLNLDYGAFTGSVISGDMTAAQSLESNMQKVIDSMTEQLKPSTGEQ